MNQNQNYLGNYQQSLGGCGSPDSGTTGNGWRAMDSAPRDGTPIEVRCTYGVAPWYGLYRWTDEITDQDGTKWHSQEKRWAKVGEDCSGFSEDGRSFTWRPYGGQAQAYVDPTGGAQHTNEYWLRACGMSSRKKFLGIF